MLGNCEADLPRPYMDRRARPLDQIASEKFVLSRYVSLSSLEGQSVSDMTRPNPSQEDQKPDIQIKAEKTNGTIELESKVASQEFKTDMSLLYNRALDLGDLSHKSRLSRDAGSKHLVALYTRV